MKDQIGKAYKEWDAAFNRADAGAVASFYAEDATLLPPTHQVIEGRRAIEEFWVGLFKAGVTGHHLQLVAAEGDEVHAIGAAHWSAQGKNADGIEQTFGGSAVHAFKRDQDRKLQLWLHTWN